MTVSFFQGMNMKGNLRNDIKSSKTQEKPTIYINMTVYVFIGLKT